MEIFHLKDTVPDKSSSNSPELKIAGLKITNLKPALKDKNRINVFVDDKFSFSLDLAQLVDFHLKIGQTLSSAELKTLQSASEFGKLYTSTLEWVLTRPRSVKETRDHLHLRLKKRELENRKRRQNTEKLKSDPDFRQKTKDLGLHLPTRPLPLFSDKDIDKVIEKLSTKGYLDDEKFAVWYIENRNLKKGISTRQLKTELNKKGIDPALMENLLETSSRSDETEAKKLLEKKLKRLHPDPKTALNDPNVRTKLLRALVSKGFSYDLVNFLLETCLEENP